MTVKADSKGRLTGAQPETKYLRKETPDGTITYIPKVPSQFNETRDVTREGFVKFFGYDPSHVPAGEDIQIHEINAPGYLPHGLVVTRFVIDKDGNRVFTEDSVDALREKVLIRIKKDTE